MAEEIFFSRINEKIDVENSQTIAMQNGVFIKNQLDISYYRTEDWQGFVYQGDILLDKYEFPLKRKPPLSSLTFGYSIDPRYQRRRRWRKGIIPFKFHWKIRRNRALKRRIYEAMTWWEESLGDTISFEPYNYDANYIVFKKIDGDGGGSYVGRRLGKQFVYIGENLPSGGIAHELGHVFGLWHEHSRSDRDPFIEICWDNIKPEKKEYFTCPTDPSIHQGNYDYNSIMHYSRYAFAIDDDLATLYPKKNPTANIGQRDFISDIDSRTVHKLYT